MRNVVLYIAMSLDGYIADENGGVEWLAGENPDGDDMQSYTRFIETVDTVLLGYRTYRQIVTELSPGNWIYGGKTCYVFTHRAEADTKDICFINRDLGPFIAELKAQTGRDIWVCGGANLVTQLLKLDLIDRFHITVIPTILGRGIRLFENRENGRENRLRLIGTKSYNGLVDLIYEPQSRQI